MAQSSQPALKLVGDYVYNPEKDRIGHGSFATVYRGTHVKTNAEVAVKRVKRSKLNNKLIANLDLEVKILNILKEVNHPNIVQLLETMGSKDHYYLIMEYCSKGDLSKFLRKHSPLKESTVKFFAQQIAAALECMRKEDVVHRDLKPQNLLICNVNGENIIKIADFGFARYLQTEDLAATLCGSPLYMAPEILDSKQYDAKGDLWSVGIILYECLTGSSPYKADNYLQLIAKIKSETIRMPNNISPECRDLLQNLLKVDPNERISFEDFFAHPFIQLSHYKEEIIPRLFPTYTGSRSLSSSSSSSSTTMTSSGNHNNNNNNNSSKNNTNTNTNTGLLEHSSPTAKASATTTTTTTDEISSMRKRAHTFHSGESSVSKPGSAVNQLQSLLNKQNASASSSSSSTSNTTATTTTTTIKAQQATSQALSPTGLVKTHSAQVFTTPSSTLPHETIPKVASEASLKAVTAQSSSQTQLFSASGETTPATDHLGLKKQPIASITPSFAANTSGSNSIEYLERGTPSAQDSPSSSHVVVKSSAFPKRSLTASEEVLEKEYVMVDKKQIEVNSFADDVDTKTKQSPSQPISRITAPNSLPRQQTFPIRKSPPSTYQFGGSPPNRDDMTTTAAMSSNYRNITSTSPPQITSFRERAHTVSGGSSPRHISGTTPPTNNTNFYNIYTMNNANSGSGNNTTNNTDLGTSPPSKSPVLSRVSSSNNVLSSSVFPIINRSSPLFDLFSQFFRGSSNTSGSGSGSGSGSASSSNKSNPMNITPASSFSFNFPPQTDTFPYSSSPPNNKLALSSNSVIRSFNEQQFYQFNSICTSYADAIMKLADIKVSGQPKFGKIETEGLEAFLLYIRALKFFSAAMSASKQLIQSSTFITQDMNQVVQSLRDKFNECVENAEALQKRFQSSLQTSHMIVEKIIYDGAMMFAKDAAARETLGQYADAEETYKCSCLLLNSLLVDVGDHSMDETDCNILQKYMSHLIKRIQFLQQSKNNTTNSNNNNNNNNNNSNSNNSNNNSASAFSPSSFSFSPASKSTVPAPILSGVGSYEYPGMPLGAGAVYGSSPSK